MSTTQSNSGLPGLALRQAWAGSWLPWLKARTDSLRARLAPPDPVLLLRADGTRCVWTGDARFENAGTSRTPKFTAVEIPEDLLLRRSLVLPNMSASNTDEALLLDVRSNSPFALEDLAWGSLMREGEDGHRRAEIVIASRRHISEFIQSRWPDLFRGEQPEVWAVAGLPAPVVITGFGEQRRLSHAQSQQRWDWVLLLVACALGSLAAMTPTAQLRLRALEAEDAFQAVVKRVAPLVRKRDEVTLLNDRLRSLDAAVADRIDPAQVLEYLTQVLPDDTHLYALDIRKPKITASGHTVDASALLQKLSSDPRLRDVRSPTAVTRAPGATKEAFVIEFTMDMKQAAIAPSPVAAASAVVAVPVPVATTAAPGASAAASAPAPAALSASPKPASPSPFVIGGSIR